MAAVFKPFKYTNEAFQRFIAIPSCAIKRLSWNFYFTDLFQSNINTGFFSLHYPINDLLLI